MTCCPIGREVHEIGREVHEIGREVPDISREVPGEEVHHHIDGGVAGSVIFEKLFNVNIISGCDNN